MVSRVRPARVAYLIQSPLDARDRDRFGVSLMRQRGIFVSVVDVTRITRPHWRDPRGALPAFPDCDHLEISTRADLGAAERVLAAADLVVCLVGFTRSAESFRVYRALTRAKTPYLVLSTNVQPGSLPETRTRIDALPRIRTLAQRAIAGNIRPLRSALALIPPQLLGIRPPSWLVVGGKASRRGAAIYPLGPATRTIPAHCMDYDLARAFRPVSGNIAVFLDENMGFQRDLSDYGVAAIVETGPYYRSLRQLFDRIERETGVEIVIAANPRSIPGQRDGFFGARRVETGRTAELVAASRFVIAHCSTSIDFAVMFGKPVLLTALRAQYRHWMNRHLFDGFSAALGVPIQFFDSSPDIDFGWCGRIDAARYRTFMADFVKAPDSPDKGLWDIVLDDIAEGAAGLIDASAPATAGMAAR